MTIRMQFFVSLLQPWGGEYLLALHELADSWREAGKEPSGIDGSTESTEPELPKGLGFKNHIERTTSECPNTSLLHILNLVPGPTTTVLYSKQKFVDKSFHHAQRKVKLIA